MLVHHYLLFIYYLFCMETCTHMFHAMFGMEHVRLLPLLALSLTQPWTAMFLLNTWSGVCARR